jgi:hypothetical protein
MLKAGVFFQRVQVPCIRVQVVYPDKGGIQWCERLSPSVNAGGAVYSIMGRNFL